MSAYPLQLGLYFNKWTNPTYGFKVSAGAKDDVVLTKVRNVIYSREGKACNEEIDEEGNMDCVLKWMQNTYVNKAHCPKGLKST